MDNYLRIALVLLGIIVVAVIVWDGYRKKRISSEKSEEFNQDALDEMLETRDGGGYDLNGVGLSRIIGDDIFMDDEPMVASRDDEPYVGDESFSADESDDDTVAGEQAQTAGSATTTSANTTNAESASNTQPETFDPDLIITISLIARSEHGFVGEKLLHCMLSRGLRFGAMEIFHRHKNTSGEGQVQFSLANALKPGTFDLDDMGSFQTKAVTLFMILPGPKDPQKAFKMLLDTAQHLADELNGQLVDGTRSALTQQTIQHFNEQIQDFERQALSRANK